MSETPQKGAAGDVPQRPAKVTGLRHLFAAAGYSFGGLRRAWREAAFRHEVLAFLAILGLFFYVGARPGDYLLFLCLAAVLFAIEALNTAIEVIIDEISPHFSNFARDAKDLGSFAVFCLLVANGAFALYVVLRSIW